MSAYTRAYQGLVKGGMPAIAAAQLLGELRAETGADLSAGLRDYAAVEHRPASADSRAIHRRKKAKFGATIAAADWVLKATAARPTMPHQRDHRSTT